MKKVLLISVFILILVAIPLTVFLVKQQQDNRQRATPASSLYFDPAAKSVNNGEQFTLNVMIDTAENRVTAMNLFIEANPTYLELVSLQRGDFFETNLIEPVISNGHASISVGINSSQGKSGTGVVATLTLKALAPTTTATLLTFGERCTDTVTENCTIAVGAQEGAVNVLTAMDVASITITETGASPSPSASASPGTASPTPQASPSVSPGSASPSPSPSGGIGGGASPTPSPSASTGTSPSPSTSPGGATPSPSPSSTAGAVTTIINPANGSSTTSKRPGINGTSFKNALVILSINNSGGNVVNDSFYADAAGNWTYALKVDLPLGSLTITVTGDDPITGKLENASSTFTITATGGTGGTGTTPSTSPSPTTVAGGGTGTGGTGAAASPSTGKGGVPVTGSTTPTIFIFIIASALLLFGFTSSFRKK